MKLLRREALYLATIGENAADVAREFGLGLEIDEFCTAVNIDNDLPAWDARVRAHLSKAPADLLHAPFSELCPCAVDPLVREITRKRFLQAAQLCERYGIRRMIVHSGFIPRVYFPEWFTEQSAIFFRSLLKELPENFELLIENVLDPDPAVLLDLIRGIDDPRARVCLDVGHAHSVSCVPLRAWPETLGPVIRHFHAHDNDGTRDAHGIPGSGTIGFPDFFGDMLAAAPNATITFECMDARACVNAVLPMIAGSRETL